MRSLPHLVATSYLAAYLAVAAPIWRWPCAHTVANAAFLAPPPQTERPVVDDKELPVQVDHFQLLLRRRLWNGLRDSVVGDPKRFNSALAELSLGSLGSDYNAETGNLIPTMESQVLKGEPKAGHLDGVVDSTSKAAASAPMMAAPMPALDDWNDLELGPVPETLQVDKVERRDRRVMGLVGLDQADTTVFKPVATPSPQSAVAKLQRRENGEDKHRYSPPAKNAAGPAQEGSDSTKAEAELPDLNESDGAISNNRYDAASTAHGKEPKEETTDLPPLSELPNLPAMPPLPTSRSKEPGGKQSGDGSDRPEKPAPKSKNPTSPGMDGGMEGHDHNSPTESDVVMTPFGPVPVPGSDNGRVGLPFEEEGDDITSQMLGGGKTILFGV